MMAGPEHSEMDPDERLADVLDAADRLNDSIAGDRIDKGAANDLLYAVRDLDDWIRGGGRLPQAWQRARAEATAEAEDPACRRCWLPFSWHYRPRGFQTNPALEHLPERR